MCNRTKKMFSNIRKWLILGRRKIVIMLIERPLLTHLHITLCSNQPMEKLPCQNALRRDTYCKSFTFDVNAPVEEPEGPHLCEVSHVTDPHL